MNRDGTFFALSSASAFPSKTKSVPFWGDSTTGAQEWGPDPKNILSISVLNSCRLRGKGSAVSSFCSRPCSVLLCSCSGALLCVSSSDVHWRRQCLLQMKNEGTEEGNNGSQKFPNSFYSPPPSLSYFFPLNSFAARWPF